MRSFVRAPDLRPPRTATRGRTLGRYVVALVCTAAFLNCAAQSAEFIVRFASTGVDKDVVFINSDIDIELSEGSIEALENGVPLTFQFDFEVRRSTWVWNSTIAKVTARYQLSAHALTGQYVLRNLNLGTAQSFVSLDSAKAALGSVRKFPLIDHHLLDAAYQHTWRIRASLDIEALPAPLRPLAYLKSLWSRGTEWYEWQLEP